MARNSDKSRGDKSGFQHSGNMIFSYSLRLNINKSRVKKDGTVTIYLLFIYLSNKKPINLHIDWPLEKVDLENEVLQPRFRNDSDCSDYNLIIKNEKAKFAEIFKFARLRRENLSFKQVVVEYENFASREDFITYAIRKIKYRVESGEIQESSADTQMSSLKTLVGFRQALPFSDISRDLMNAYKGYLYNKLKLDSDTVHTKLKNIRIYMNLAKEDGFLFRYPFGEGFKMPVTEGRIEYASEDEVQLLKRYFWKGDLTPGTNKEKSLRAFLFICYTGLRLADIKLISHKHIKKGCLEFIPDKSDKDHQHAVTIPLHEEAKKLIDTKEGKLFILPPDSKLRESLKWIRDKLGIESKIGPHIGRHTFATRFLASGGRLEVLQQLLGHKKITTTMIYVHVSEDMKRKEINNLQ